MNKPNPESSETIAAVAFMSHKGYQGAEPLGVEVVETALIWYFYFEVPEGLIELEVEYGHEPDRLPVPTWQCRVSEFWTYDEMPSDWRPREFVQQRLASVEDTGG